MDYFHTTVLILRRRTHWILPLHGCGSTQLEGRRLSTLDIAKSSTRPIGGRGRRIVKRSSTKKCNIYLCQKSKIIYFQTKNVNYTNTRQLVSNVWSCLQLYTTLKTDSNYMWQIVCCLNLWYNFTEEETKISRKPLCSNKLCTAAEKPAREKYFESRGDTKGFGKPCLREQ